MSTLKIRRASEIQVRRAHWTWTSRVPRGELALLAGREGIGKSTLAYWMVAAITTGTLPGEHAGQPRSAVVVATEDSWEHTIVPRLVAAGADLTRVIQVEAALVDEDGEQWPEPLSLPRDVEALRRLLATEDVGLVVLDPLLSRLSGTLDSHKDAQVRQALEPLVRVAHEARCAVVGIIHVNKAATSDVLNSVMGSRAFTATARAVLYVMTDPEDEGTRLVGLAKCNIGPTDIPTLTFTIASQLAGRDPDDGTEVWSGALAWTGETDRSVSEALRASRALDDEDGDERDQCAAWLADYLVSNDGEARPDDVTKAGRAAGWSVDQVKRAKKPAGVRSVKSGMTGGWVWQLSPEGSTKGAKRAREHETSRDLLPSLSSLPSAPTCRVCGGLMDPAAGSSHVMCGAA